MAPLRWLRRKLAGALGWVAKLIRAPLRTAVRAPLWLTRRSAVRWLIGALVRPREERGFGFWWLVATIAIAGAVGLIVAALVTPVAGLLAVLAVGIWALISHLSGRRAEAKRQERRERGASGGAPGTAAPAADHGPPIATAPAAH